MKNGTLQLYPNNLTNSSRNFNSGFKTTASMSKLAKLNDNSYFGSEQALIISSLKQTHRVDTYNTEGNPMQIQ